MLRSRTEVETDKSRCKKWREMLKELKSGESRSTVGNTNFITKGFSSLLNVIPTVGQKGSKLKSRARKGIPDSMRGNAWFITCEANK